MFRINEFLKNLFPFGRDQHEEILAEFALAEVDEQRGYEDRPQYTNSRDGQVYRRAYSRWT